MPTKQRNTNLELYRIIAMLLIVAHHYVVNSGVMHIMLSDGFTIRSTFYFLLGMWGKIGINCFVLITGYFMCRSNITLKKFLKLFLEIEFYFVSVYLVFVAVGYEVFSFTSILKKVLWFAASPVANGFTNCFMLFWLFIPFLNILAQHMNKRQHGLLVILTLGIFSIIGSIPHVGITFNYVEWFCVLYFIASYLRNYPPQYLCRKNAKIYSIISLVLAMGSVIAARWLNVHTQYDFSAYFLITDSNKLLAVLVAVTTFSWFKEMKIPTTSFINVIASTTFGVLLIHANCTSMRQWLWKDVFDVIGHYSTTYYVIYSILVVLIVFAVCSFIDYLRIILLEKPLFRKLEHIYIIPYR